MVREEAAKLTLGPLFFYWGAERWRDFYFRVADEAPVDTVCLGEVVCAKRWPFLAPVVPAVVARLRRAGKEIVFSSLILIRDEDDLSPIAEAADEDDLVEANDVAALAVFEGRRHVIGPFVNVYNEGTLGYLAARGAVRVCLSAELPRESMATLAAACDVPLEVQIFGRLPLAISARCYHARAHGRSKSACRFVCIEDTDGMSVNTLDGAPLFAVNGVQTLSHAYGNLLGEIAALRQMGTTRFRLSPHSADMAAITQIYRDCLDGRTDPDEASAQLSELMPNAQFANGFFHGTPGMELVDGTLV